MLAVGYMNPGTKRKETEPAKGGYIIVRNSWSEQWGDRGYGYMPYEFFPGGSDAPAVKPLADDFWTLTKMDFPDLPDANAAPFAIGE